MGRHWYLNGKADKKTNTFTDFIACAEHLIATGLTSPEQLAINGGSAGGLLMGAVINMRSDLFRAVVAQVPFVDVLTTMPSVGLRIQDAAKTRSPSISTIQARQLPSAR